MDVLSVVMRMPLKTMVPVNARIAVIAFVRNVTKILCRTHTCLNTTVVTFPYVPFAGPLSRCQRLLISDQFLVPILSLLFTKIMVTTQIPEDSYMACREGGGASS